MPSKKQLLRIAQKASLPVCLETSPGAPDPLSQPLPHYTRGSSTPEGIGHLIPFQRPRPGPWRGPVSIFSQDAMHQNYQKGGRGWSVSNLGGTEHWPSSQICLDCVLDLRQTFPPCYPLSPSFLVSDAPPLPWQNKCFSFREPGAYDT